MLFHVDGRGLLLGQNESDQPAGRISAEQESKDSSQARVDEAEESKNATIPDWFESEATYDDRDGMLFVETVDTCLNQLEAQEALKSAVELEVNRVLDRWFGAGAGRRIGFTGEYLLEHLVYQQRLAVRADDSPELMELLETHEDIGEVSYFVGYAQLHLDDEFRQLARDRWLEVRTHRRLLRSGLLGAAIFSLLAVIFSYLKLESATRGFYSRRLQTIALILALIIVAVTAWLGQTLVS